MRNIFVLGFRVLNQLIRDKWFLFFSIAAPIMIIIVLRIFFDTFPERFPVEDYVVGIAAMVVFVITFVLSMISVVEERVNGTLQRMFINGVSKTAIIVGYMLGYLAIATVQATITVFMTLRLFELEYDLSVLVLLFLAIWLLAVASVALGLLISSFVRRQVQIIPFIPIVMLPSVFLSGIIVDLDQLPLPALIIGKATPLHYANNIIEEVTVSGWELVSVMPQAVYLGIVIATIIFFASLTLKPIE